MARLGAHLANWLGTWPASGELSVAGSSYRETPGWDGKVRVVAGVSTPTSTVLSLPPALVEPAEEIAAAGGITALAEHLGELVGLPRYRLRDAVFRSCRSLVETEDIGEWVSPEDERVPAWLQVFDGDVLVVFDDEGRYIAGVGRKAHDGLAQEIAVGTEEAHRGKGLAKALVAKAARQIYEEGAVATYLHRRDNLASARVAESVGFPDLGWAMLGLTPPPSGRLGCLGLG